MAYFRNAKQQVRILLCNSFSSRIYHTNRYYDTVSRGSSFSQPGEVKGYSRIKYVNPGPAFGLISRQFSNQAPSGTEQMNLIKQLRERTSAPIKDVKLALIDCNWDPGMVIECSLYY